LTTPVTGNFGVEDADPTSERAVAIALASRIAAGDSGAEDELVSRYQRGILQILKCNTQDAELARDICQETFIVVLRRLRNAPLETPARLAAFIAQTARKLLIGSKRLAARRKTSADSDAVENAVDDAPTGRDIEAESAAELVRRLLVELKSERDRQALLRFYVKEEPRDRICAELKVTETQFNLILFRAREQMRTLLRRRGVGPRDLLSHAWAL
jgi:RNA polymerase sigma factor (sigma-70 family)